MGAIDSALDVWNGKTELAIDPETPEDLERKLREGVELASNKLSQSGTTSTEIGCDDSGRKKCATLGGAVLHCYRGKSTNRARKWKRSYQELHVRTRSHRRAELFDELVKFDKDCPKITLRNSSQGNTGRPQASAP
ncbi:expressed unknown protein [Seminavis robusta]|uniref:Uncharacterized protein n=1 Tax=Seminavis robusta TaxID=568900 RepID=A0A9N8E9K5_9STRA|nr:expressed unknown protein [Seminavis robusta]|eukprot:Sro808_g205370.1 n/a (136) ;mRNA; f:10725-11132